MVRTARPSAHDRHLIGQGEHLVQEVRDEEHRDALIAQRADQTVELTPLGHGQPGRGFVHHHQLGTACHRSQNLHALLVGHAEFADPGHGVDVNASALGQGAKPPARLLGTDASPTGGLHAEKDIVHHGAIGHQRQLLGDGGDAEVEGVPRRAESDRPTVYGKRPAVRRVEPGDDLAERGLPGAVLADERVDGAAVDGEAHAVHRLR